MWPFVRVYNAQIKSLELQENLKTEIYVSPMKLVLELKRLQRYSN